MKHKTQIMRGLVVLLLAALMPIAAFAQGANYSLNKDFEGNVNAFFDALARGEPGDIFVVDLNTGSSTNPIDWATDVSDGVTLQIDSFLHFKGAINNNGTIIVNMTSYYVSGTINNYGTITVARNALLSSR